MVLALEDLLHREMYGFNQHSPFNVLLIMLCLFEQLIFLLCMIGKSVVVNWSAMAA